MFIDWWHAWVFCLQSITARILYLAPLQPKHFLRSFHQRVICLFANVGWIFLNLSFRFDYSFNVNRPAYIYRNYFESGDLLDSWGIEQFFLVILKHQIKFEKKLSLNHLNIIFNLPSPFWNSVPQSPYLRDTTRIRGVGLISHTNNRNIPVLFKLRNFSRRDGRLG